MSFETISLHIWIVRTQYYESRCYLTVWFPRTCEFLFLAPLFPSLRFLSLNLYSFSQPASLCLLSSPLSLCVIILLHLLPYLHSSLRVFICMFKCLPASSFCMVFHRILLLLNLWEFLDILKKICWKIVYWFLLDGREGERPRFFLPDIVTR